MIKFLRCIIGVLLVFDVSLAFAGTTYTNVPTNMQYYWQKAGQPTTFATAAEACQAVGQTLGACSSTYGGVCVMYYCNGGSGGQTSRYGYFACPNGVGQADEFPNCTGTCSAGQEYNATTNKCEVMCKAGQTKVNGVCQCDNGASIGTDGSCCPVAGSGGGAPMQWCYVASGSATNCDSSGANGCKIRCNNVSYQTGTGASLQIYPKLALGTACSYTGTLTPPGTGGAAIENDSIKDVQEATKNPAKADTPAGCLASGQGYVTSSSGTTSCVSSGETGNVVQKVTDKADSTVKNPTTGAQETTTTETTKSETTSADGGKTTTTAGTTTNPDGTKQVVTTTRTLNPDGTVTESVKTESVAADGTKTSTKQTNGTEEAGTFCQKNPTDPICKGFGDSCKENPDRVGCSEFGSPVEGENLGTRQIGTSSIATVGLGSNATCPADINIRNGIKVSYDWICMYASGLRPVILALAWLSAGFLIFGIKLE